MQASVALLILAQIQKSQLLLWLFVGVFGFFEGLSVCGDFVTGCHVSLLVVSVR